MRPNVLVTPLATVCGVHFAPSHTRICPTEGDVTATLGLLIDEIKRIGVVPSVIDERRRKWRDAHDKQRSGILHQQATARRADVLSVPAICEIMARVMSPDAIYVEETITHAIPLRHHLPLNRSQSFFRHNGGGLGQVLGIALGIKLAAPERPVVVFAGVLLGEPMTLVFNNFELVALIGSTIIAALISNDGESNWMEGAQLLSLYVILGVAFYFT